MTTQGRYDQSLVGRPVYAGDGDKLGTVKEVRGRSFKVDAPMQPDFWLSFEAIRNAGGEGVMVYDRSDLDRYMVQDVDEYESEATTMTERSGSSQDHTHQSGQTETHTHQTGQTETHAHQQTGAAQTGTARSGSEDATRRVELREEQLNVEKERVQAGEVGIRKEVVSEQQTVDVPVMREEVVIEKRDVADRPASGPIGSDSETIRVPVSEERVNVEKETVVTGEVEIGKRQTQETQRVTETVRREEARVEHQGEVDVQGGQRGSTQQSGHEHGGSQGGQRRS